MIPIPQNPAHWHILLAHIPALLYMVSIVILALATFWRDVRWQRVALGFIVAASICTVVVFQFGESGEDIVETLPGTEQYIHPHEELAETARNIILPFGILILALWWFTRKHTLLPAWASWGVIAVMLGIIILLANVAGAGGKINHPEIRPGFGAGTILYDSDDDDDD